MTAALQETVRKQLLKGREKSLEHARTFLNENVVISTQQQVFNIADGQMWIEPHPRSTLRWLHGFEYMVDWTTAWDQLNNHERIALVTRLQTVIEDWTSKFGFRPGDDPMAYHDETTALRLQSLMALHRSPIGPKLGDHFEALMEATALLLSEKTFHSGLNNHGMLQDGALLIYGAMLQLEERPIPFEVLDVWDRILTYARTTFGVDGVHKEHSPVYHLLVCEKLADYSNLASAMRLPPSEFLKQLLVQAAEFALHATTPGSAFVPLGDTSREKIPVEAISIFDSAEFEWAVTHERGVPPVNRAAVFEESGYAAFRTSWTDRNATYLMLANAYHGSYHKHSDELNVYLESGGVPILDDAGPYGYDYGDPLVQHAYSSFGHNTLLVDGKGLKRHDGAMEKTWFQDLGSTENQLRVCAFTSRYDGVIASREVEVQGESTEKTHIRIQDKVSSDQSHRYTYLWHFGPDLVPVLRGSGVELYRDGSKIGEVLVSSDTALRLNLLRGNQNPEKQALHFSSMGKVQESTALEVELFAGTAAVTTDVRLGDYVLVDRGVKPNGEWLTSAGNVPLRYLLEVEPSSITESLTVIFSSLRQPGDFAHDYRSALRGTKTSKLFILDDFGERGSYYYSHGRDTSIFHSVQALIADIAESLGIHRSKITTIGSSKGGSAALIHGYAARVGRVIVGAPQILIGNYTSGHAPEVLRYLAGGSTPGDREWANEILSNVIKDGSRHTRVSVLVGTEDHHLLGHIRPFEKMTAASGKPISVSVVPGVSHGDIGTVYRDFARHAVLNGSKVSVPYMVRYDETSTELVIAVGDLLHARVAACYLYSGNELLAKSPYSDEPVRRWKVTAGRNYHVRVFIRDGAAQLPTFNTEILDLTTKNDFD
ncbi:heparinase II/III family protein [Arthrobacter sp. MYb224]|uniref:heparinase II/III domain-containing protein n=1 Tax=Arthrobacter sp. MYb224 TaxID=1848600 RepID=UPI0015E35FA6|nr:heparinase II/III family protein [Arthrobacter sp. MYb224]